MKTTSHLRTRLTVSGVRRSAVCKPLVVLLSLLLLPDLSWMLPEDAAVPSAVQAQVVTGCTPSGKNVIRTFCTADGLTAYFTDVQKLESDAVKAYLGMHGLPDSDASVVYTYGRADLRSKIRALISTRLQSIVGMDASARTAHEQALYDWLQTWVHKHELKLYEQAVEHYSAWFNNACTFTLDPDLARQYGLSYNGAPFCNRPPGSLFGLPLPTVPSASYFKAYGLKKSYLAKANEEPNYGTLLADLNIDVGVVATVATFAMAAIGAAAAGVLVSASLAALAVFTAKGAAIAAAVQTGLFISGVTVSSVGVVGVVAAPVAVILIAIAIGIAAGVQVFEYEASIDQLNELSATLTRLRSTPPALEPFVADTTGVGTFKLTNTILTLTLPDLPSTAPLPAHRPGIDLVFTEDASGIPFAYKDWNGNNWSAQTWGGWLVQTCQKGAGSTVDCAQASSITADIRIKDPRDRTRWTASRMGSVFHLAAGETLTSEQVPCEADALLGVSGSQDPATCSGYATRTLIVERPDGSPAATELTPFAGPFFSTPLYLSFTAGVTATKVITVTGNPPPQINVFGGTVTANPDFALAGGGDGTLQVSFNGNANAPAQDYTLNLFAGGEESQVFRTYTIRVGRELAISSPATVTATAAVPVNFLVTTVGTPTPTLTIDQEALAAGLTFTDNGDGTATIAGVSPEPGEFICLRLTPEGFLVPCGITATNSQGSVFQQLTINLESAPAATRLGPNEATFTAGVGGFVLLTSSGATTPVKWVFVRNESAPWITLRDHGTGTATLSVVPPPGTVGTFEVNAIPDAAGSRGTALFFNVHVVDKPVFTSPNAATFTVGTSGSFAASANLGSIDLEGTLPAGLTFAAGNPATISGVAAAGTGGQHTVTLIDEPGTGAEATQFLTLNVYEAPHITSPNAANLFVGIPGSFAVTTRGYPSVSTRAVLPEELPPTSPDQGAGTHFTVTGLPAGMSATNRSPEGFATGTLTIQGTPAAAGSYPVTITARNGVGGPAQQTLMLNVVGITGVAPTSGTTCNGNYSGTFNGNIRVSAGQNCAFYGGGVNGSVTLIGGSFAVAGTTISGNVSLQGASAFSIGTGTTIGGNLTIQNVGSGSSNSQICGARVVGNASISGNAVPITIGSQEASCAGNVFSGNLGITFNTASVQVFENGVAKNLSCSSNGSIAGAGNTASKKTGQCAGF